MGNIGFLISCKLIVYVISYMYKYVSLAFIYELPEIYTSKWCLLWLTGCLFGLINQFSFFSE